MRHTWGSGYVAGTNTLSAHLIRSVIALFVLGGSAQANEFFVLGGDSDPNIIRVDATTGQFIGNGGSVGESFYDMTWGPDGYIYGAGMGIGNGIINRFRSDGSFVSAFVPPGLADYGNTGTNPSRIAFGADGNLYASSTRFQLFGGFSKQGLLEFNGQTGAYMGAVLTDSITDVARGPDQQLYVAEPGTIRRYNFTTNAWSTFENNGLAADAMAFGPDNDLYVLSNHSVLQYDSQGNLLGTFATISSTFTSLHDLTFGGEGDLYVTDENTMSILRFDGDTGAPLGTFSSLASVIQFPTESMFGILLVPEPSAGMIAIAAIMGLGIRRHRLNFSS
ncbi:MAG TPA: hypothetical protein VHS31_10160 [Tepidisphaeraceae bacterium]|jgi:DNA-binding beta-propeller fold protein YncE|nr:hypothetical protein [Tepidisphaeraceae bacterium]